MLKERTVKIAYLREMDLHIIKIEKSEQWYDIIEREDEEEIINLFSEISDSLNLNNSPFGVIKEETKEVIYAFTIPSKMNDNPFMMPMLTELLMNLISKKLIKWEEYKPDEDSTEDNKKEETSYRFCYAIDSVSEFMNIPNYGGKLIRTGDKFHLLTNSFAYSDFLREEKAPAAYIVVTDDLSLICR